MKFCWSTITVNDMEASLSFYRELVGLPLDRRFAAGGAEIAFLGEGGTQVELICDKSRPAPGKVEGISLGFAVPSLDEMMKRAGEKGIEIESGPFQPSPQVRFFFVKDPNGVSIQFVETL